MRTGSLRGHWRLLRSGRHLYGNHRGGVLGSEHLAGCLDKLHSKSLRGHRRLLRSCRHLHGDDSGGMLSSSRLAGGGHDLLAEPLPAAGRRLLRSRWHLHGDN